MNILFLSRDYPPNHIGGVGIYVYEMSRLLSKSGHQVFVITEAAESPLDYIDDGVHIFRVKSETKSFLNPIRNIAPQFTERLKYSQAVSNKIKEVFSQYKIDILESCEARAEGFWYYLFNKNPPLVIKLHTPEGIVFRLNGEQHTNDRFLIEKLEEWWLRKANQIVGLSKSIIELTSKYYGIKFKDPPIVPNPIDASVFNPKTHYNNENIVLYTGRLEFRKGVHILIRAIPGVLEEVPQAKFIFIGDDCGMKSYLLKKANELRIQDCVEFIGQVPREKLADYYQHSSVCVVPSLWENHPYAILEAMASGIPVIASRVGGIPEIISDQINGILVSPGSFLELTKAIIKVLTNRQLQMNLGREALKFIEIEYAPLNILEANLKIYKNLLNHDNANT
jgi:glycosyltransferase involved in cell wall biosynthesis